MSLARVRGREVAAEDVLGCARFVPCDSHQPGPRHDPPVRRSTDTGVRGLAHLSQRCRAHRLRLDGPGPDQLGEPAMGPHRTRPECLRRAARLRHDGPGRQRGQHGLCVGRRNRQPRLVQELRHISPGRTVSLWQYHPGRRHRHTGDRHGVGNDVPGHHGVGWHHQRQHPLPAGGDRPQRRRRRALEPDDRPHRRDVHVRSPDRGTAVGALPGEWQRLHPVRRPRRRLRQPDHGRRLSRLGRRRTG